MLHWVLLAICIVLEVAATTLLKLSNGFSNLYYALSSLLLFWILFFLLSIVFKYIAVGIAYAIWSGVGITLISIVGYIFLGQKLDAPAIIGIALIVLGVVIINVFSKSIT